MRLLKSAGWIFLLGGILISCEKIKNLGSEPKPAPIETEEEKTSYILGWILADNTKKAEAGLQSQAFLQGVKDNIEGKQPALKPEDIAAVHGKLQQKAQKRKQEQEGESNQMEGKKFLEANKAKEGVKSTESGLQYEVLKVGTGKAPVETDIVEVHYRGTLLDGTEFDSSYKNNAPVSFPLNGVIKGWTEGLQLMKEGAKYKFYIPSDLAYGAKGAGQRIPPHASLIFEVELLKVKQP